MNRRDFIRILLASAVAETVDVEKLLWTPKPIITVPANGLDLFFDMDKLKESLYGIPYHEYLGSTRTWQGLSRSEVPMWSSQWVDDNIKRILKNE